MNIHKLDCIFNPQRIAILGASTNPNSVSGKTLSNLVGSGFRGVVYPVVLKINSPDITHKTEVGGVMLNLDDAQSVREAFGSIHRNLKKKAPAARFEGVTVQRMAQTKEAVEMILGIKKDADAPFAHLALQPYPAKYTCHCKLKDESSLTLRPIKPEDEPLWFALLRSCSKESIYSRFRYFFHWETHEVASRYCYIDYDREVAIVAETGEGENRRIVGVGRLIADPDHESVEYAVLIADDFQHKELGSLLTDYCLEIAKHWKLKKVVAQTTTDNERMVSVFKKRGFEIVVEDGTVYVEKNILE